MMRPPKKPISSSDKNSKLRTPNALNDHASINYIHHYLAFSSNPNQFVSEKLIEEPP